ncbi:MAG: GNAT family N-acetyltransferase [Clostridiales bacterium]|jgi:ribosomal protein S18 acetylase RimI-like enzyme|nr:GNAT family N-acetyltransferase [Clostridiales bacterium]
MEIMYTKDMGIISEDMLDGGFFAGWPNAPDAAVHLRLLRESYLAYVAIDVFSGKVVGFISAISDGVLSAYIPLLEVLPQYQGRGIGGALVRHMLAALDGLYMIDIVCDEDKAPLYAKYGAIMHGRACIFRNHEAQSGRA